MSRPNVAMTSDAVAAFLRGQQAALIVANAQHGGFNVRELPFDVDGDRISIHLALDDPLLDDLAADNRICITVEHFDSYHDLRGALFHGAAHVEHSHPLAATVTIGTTNDVVSYDFSRLPRA